MSGKIITVVNKFGIPMNVTQLQARAMQADSRIGKQHPSIQRQINNITVVVSGKGVKAKRVRFVEETK